jgi:DNA recombination protein RmuC
MERVLFVLNGTPVAESDLLLAAAAIALLLLATMALSVTRRTRMDREEMLAATGRQREILQALTEFSRQSAGLDGMLCGMAKVLGSRQADLARLVSERLDAVGMRVGAGLEASGKSEGQRRAKVRQQGLGPIS